MGKVDILENLYSLISKLSSLNVLDVVKDEVSEILLSLIDEVTLNELSSSSFKNYVNEVALVDIKEDKELVLHQYYGSVTHVYSYEPCVKKYFRITIEINGLKVSKYVMCKETSRSIVIDDVEIQKLIDFFTYLYTKDLEGDVKIFKSVNEFTQLLNNYKPTNLTCEEVMKRLFNREVKIEIESK